MSAGPAVSARRASFSTTGLRFARCLLQVVPRTPPARRANLVRGWAGVAAGQGRRAGVGKATPGLRLIVVLWLPKLGAGRGLAGVPGFGGAAGARHGGHCLSRPAPRPGLGLCSSGGSARCGPAEGPEQSPPVRVAGLAGGAVLSARGCGDCWAPPGCPRPGHTGGDIAGSRFQRVGLLSPSIPRRGEAEPAPSEEGALRGAGGRPARRRSPHAGHLEAAVPCHRVAG